MLTYRSIFFFDRERLLATFLRLSEDPLERFGDLGGPMGLNLKQAQECYQRNRLGIYHPTSPPSWPGVITFADLSINERIDHNREYRHLCFTNHRSEILEPHCRIFVG